MCLILFTLPANAEYNPKALYVSPAADLQNDYLYNALIQEEFTVTISDTIPENMDEYDLVVVASYNAAWRQTADYIKEYVANGGGTVIMSGVPAFFPYTYTPHSLSQGFYGISYVSEWFGTPSYQNVGGSEALITIDNPLGTDLKIGDKVGYSTSAGAAVSNLHTDDTQLLASWTNSGYVAAFTHTYEIGRVFYYATSDGSENSHKLILAGALWAADFSNYINKISIVDDYIQHLPDDAFERNPDQRKNAFSEKFEDVIELIDAEEYKEATDKLKNDIRSKADGHVDGNLKNDWIIDPEAQKEICEMVDDLMAYIETL